MTPHHTRRSFLQLPLAAAALAMANRVGAGGAEAARPATGSRQGGRVAANHDRHGEELLVMGGRFDLKVSTQDSDGDLLIYDTIRREKGGPALHRHHAQDEWFYVIRGEFIVRLGDETLELHPGDCAFAPRRIPHAFAMTSEAEGQMLVLFQPAGRMEDFFHAMSKLGSGIQKNQEAMKQLWAEHGIEIVGPPLRV